MATSNMLVDPDDASRGFTVIAPYYGNRVYLVDGDGDVVHTWQSNRLTTGTAILLENGTLLRMRSGGTGQSYGIHLLDWDGKVLWDWQPPDPYQIHHDMVLLPSGNILVNGMFAIADYEAVALGRDPTNTAPMLSIEPILEIEPNGTTGGDVVWTWNPLDHIVQDYDSSKPDYGVVKDHPELLDFNYPHQIPDEWTHSNSLSYNVELDQIMVTDRNFDELWIIDHNTTTEEAAGHTGGARGKGGDILYRWGNPQAYDTGDEGDHVLYGPHDAKWIAPGLPGAGNVIVFNNGKNMLMARPEGNYSSVEELVPPVNSTGGYDLDPGSAYGPTSTTWRYVASPPESFWALTMGGVERLPGGNTLVCGGSTGNTLEVTSSGATVWSYQVQAIYQAHRYYPPALDRVPRLNATEDVVLRVDLSDYIWDLDTDKEDLVVTARSLFATVNEHELLLVYPEGVTSDAFNLTVTDGIFEAARRVRVNITPVNDPPRFLEFPDIPAVEGVPYLLDLKPLVSDPDNELADLVFTVDSSFVTVDRGQLRFLYPDGVLEDRFNLSVSDGELEDTTEVNVTVMPTNDPPVVDLPKVLECVEDVPLVVDLWAHIQDNDTAMWRLSISSTSPYATISGRNLTLLYPDGVTEDVVSITIRDGTLVTIKTIEVVVEPVNDPPVLMGPSTVNVTEDMPYFLDLEEVIWDEDTPMEDLTPRVDSPFVEVAGHTLIFLYPDGVLRDEVVVQILDGEVVSNVTLGVIVEPVNDPPEMDRIGPVTVKEDEEFQLDLAPALSDVDTPLEELKLVVDSPYATVEGRILRLVYPEGVDRDEITVQVTDGQFNAIRTLAVTVEPVNDPPTWTGDVDIRATEDVEGELSLRGIIGDVDTPLDGLVVHADTPYGTMDGHTFRYLYPEGVLRDLVTFTLTDGESQVILRTNVTVSPVNDAPELSDARVDRLEGGEGTRFMFSVVFRDIDMGVRTPTVVVVIDGVEHRCERDGTEDGPYDEGVLFRRSMRLEPGEHTVRFRALDGDGGETSSGPLSVKVEDTSSLWDSTLMVALTISLLVAGATPMVTMFLRGRRDQRGGA